MMKHAVREWPKKMHGYLAALASLAVLMGCNPSPSDETPPSATTARLSIEPIKQFHFEWQNSAGASHYRLLENPDGQSGFTQVGNDIPSGTTEFDLEVPLYARVNAQYIVQSCNAGGCNDSNTLAVTGNLTNAIGYVKASDTENEAIFGVSVALDQTGRTLAVGASEVSKVYVFTRTGVGTWQQQQVVQSNQTETGDDFGTSVSLSADGDRLVVGANSEDSNDTGVNGNESNNDAGLSGAVYVFRRTGALWAQEAYLKASNTGEFDNFGFSVSLSEDGSRLAVGAINESSNATSVNGDQDNDGASKSGAVYMFHRTGTNWAQEAYLKASNTNADDRFGFSVSLSADGSRLAVGARNESSSATSLNGDQSNNAADGSGAVYMFHRTGTNWAQEAYLKASNTNEGDDFGTSVSLSADGDRLAVGARNESSSATSLNGDQSNNEADGSGAVYMFHRTGTNWAQEAYLKASNTNERDHFGTSVSLSADGDRLVVGADGEEGNATGVNGDESNNDVFDSGAVYVFHRTGAVWAQEAYLKASNTDEGESAQFGDSLSLSGDGSTLAVGAYEESSNATGIQGDSSDRSLSEAGAVYLY